MATNPLTITGAGLVGSLWALLMRQQGHEVHVFERRADPRKNNAAAAGRSINLVITSRGLYGLDRAGCLQKALDLAVPVYGRMMHGRDGAQVYQPYGQSNECNYSISRSLLNQFLIDEAEGAGVRFHFEHELIDLDLHHKNALFLKQGHPHSVSFQVMFGTDGAGSKVRQALLQNHPEHFQEKTEWLEADYKELTWPVDQTGKNSLRKDALHIWPRGTHMMMALANQDGSFTVTLYLPREKNIPSFASVSSPIAVKELFAREFPDAVVGMPDAVHEFMSNPQGRLGTVRTSHWTWKGQVCLMGDAAHAIVPFFGQGMNSGFEDCTVLLDLMQKFPNNWEKCFSEYDLFQRPNGNAIADMAVENWTEMRDRVADPKFLLRKKIESALEEKFPGRYKSRYGLVAYTRVPYSEAQRIGKQQDTVLSEVCKDIHDIKDVNWEKLSVLLEIRN